MLALTRPAGVTDRDGERHEQLGFEAAVGKAKDRTQLGCGSIAVTDPSFDVDGWDATVKVSALATALTLAPALAAVAPSPAVPPPRVPGAGRWAGSAGVR